MLWFGIFGVRLKATSTTYRSACDALHALLTHWEWGRIVDTLLKVGCRRCVSVSTPSWLEAALYGDNDNGNMKATCFGESSLAESTLKNLSEVAFYIVAVLITIIDLDFRHLSHGGFKSVRPWLRRHWGRTHGSGCCWLSALEGFWKMM